MKEALTKLCPLKTLNIYKTNNFRLVLILNFYSGNNIQSTY